jgi:uncharacterized protein YxjI
MHEALRRNLFVVREHVGFFRAANNFDILDPETGEVILLCREEQLGWFTKLLRFTDYKRYTPFNIEVQTPAGERILQVTRGVAILRSRVTVRNAQGEILGGFQQKLLSIGGKFDVLDPDDIAVCTLQGKWTGWDFRFLSGDQELAHVTKKWAGLGQELFTSADNYVISISESVPPQAPVRELILAAVLCIDMVLKE